MATYAQPEGTEDATYFQDVQISPATVADGSLLQRFDTIAFPVVGESGTAQADVDTADMYTPSYDAPGSYSLGYTKSLPHS